MEYGTKLNCVSLSVGGCVLLNVLEEEELHSCTRGAGWGHAAGHERLKARPDRITRTKHGWLSAHAVLI